MSDITREYALDKIETLRIMSEEHDLSNRVRYTYEWELGRDIIGLLMDQYNHFNPDEICVLMGYPVRINVQDPERIKLWCEIKVGD